VGEAPQRQAAGARTAKSKYSQGTAPKSNITKWEATQDGVNRRSTSCPPLGLRSLQHHRWRGSRQGQPEVPNARRDNFRDNSRSSGGRGDQDPQKQACL